MKNRYLSIKESLKLRRLEVQTSKNVQSAGKLLIGFNLTKDAVVIKINFLMELPDSLLTDLEIQNLINDQITIFTHKFQKELDKGLIALKKYSTTTNKNLFNNFKNLFAQALSEATDDSVRFVKLNQAFKKLNSLEVFTEEENKLNNIVDELNITEYHNYFSLARKVKRKLKLYLGPTNSGKTFRALNDLTSHKTGVYLSPLRLLAWEGKEEIEKRGFDCSLITGEEREIVEGAKFKAQTIETLNFSEVIDAVLIDEVQMLYDISRGWAWTQALIGSPCKELIMAGSPEVEPLIRKIAQLLDEELEVIKLERFNPLEVNSKIYQLPQDFNKIPEGTALIAFSRKNVLAMKDYFLSHKKPVSVIYGNLSPEVRKEEARKFREGITKFLISTDAIAMGLNLPISNVIFTTVEKFNGFKNTTLTPMEIKQIAGRAGRYGKVEKGEVSALDPQTLKYIKNFIKAQGVVNDFLYIKPSLEHVQKISEELKTENLFTILTFFTNKIMSKVSNLYLCSNLDESKELALVLDKIKGLSLEDKFLFGNAPVPGEDHYRLYANWLKKYVTGQKVGLPQIKDLNPRDFKFDQQLITENYIKILHLYSWLSFKKSQMFPDHEECLLAREKYNKIIENYLKLKSKK